MTLGNALTIVFLLNLCQTKHVCKVPRASPIIHATSYDSLSKRSTVNTQLKFSIVYTSGFQNNTLFEQIKTKIVLPALTYWEKSLGVKKIASDNIILERQCLDGQTSYVKWPNGTIGIYCNKGCENITRCFTEPIPDNYLNGCKTFVANKPSIQGSRGSGIPPNGYLVFVDASATEPCQSEDLLAYALACQLEFGTDRPVAGYVNMCPTQLSIKPEDVRSSISTFIHEMAHALGFSSTSYAFLREEDGTPRTPRDPQTNLPALGQDSDYIYLASKSTVTKVQRIWVSAVSTTIRTIDVFVLPSVLAEARAHYNCPTMDGMDLENDGGSGTAFVHFEKRITEDELMSGSYSKDSYVSSLTLAYFKDTGWYNVNMSMAQNWRFGKNWGCEFVQLSCYEYMKIQVAKNNPITPYCNKLSSTDVKCLVYDDAFGSCDLQRQKEKVPGENQYFTSIDGVSASDLPYYAGGPSLSDRCPIHRPFEPVTGYKYTSYCRHIENQDNIDSQNNYALQYFGQDSICVNHDTYAPWISIVGGFYRDISFPYASCHKYNCSSVGIELLVGQQVTKCSDGESIPINAYSNNINARGLVLCPTCNAACSVCSYTSVVSNRTNSAVHTTSNNNILLIHWIMLYNVFNLHIFLT
ncbi:unnamed protein product [Schistosoma guineensis]|nr:unnamed protein product [Schistosoma guineensis]